MELVNSKLQFIEQYRKDIAFLERRLDIIRDFCNTTPKIINGSIRQVDKTNKEYQRIQKLSVTLEEMNSNFFRIEQQIAHLTMTNSNLESENISLNKKVKEQEIIIGDLEDALDE